MKAPDGAWRRVYVRIVHDAKWARLGNPAQLMFFHLKLLLPSEGIGKLYRDQLEDLAVKDWEAGVAELIAHGWLKVEGRVWWLVNGLLHEPPSHRPGEVKKIIARMDSTLPETNPLVREFREYYAEVLAVAKLDAPRKRKASTRAGTRAPGRTPAGGATRGAHPGDRDRDREKDAGGRARTAANGLTPIDLDSVPAEYRELARRVKQQAAEIEKPATEEGTMERNE